MKKLDIVKDAVITSIKRLHSNGWENKRIRRATIHTLLTFQGIIPQRNSYINPALRELISEGRLIENRSSKGNYYSLTS
jgi:hypothetical protein